MPSILDLSDAETQDFVNESLSYCAGIVTSNLFNGDDGTEYSMHSIDIMYKLSETIGMSFDWAAARNLLNTWFTAELDSDDHPEMNWSYLAIPAVWDEYIVNRDAE
jgi:hypothetical protein